ncbi:acyl-CoA reductase [Clostridium estertheticum]|uniref:acyl-CoA reductase n=1 Tax=Clostridium estertheticum TaxID=238834 RepID=UPI001CF5EC5B|nr:acyl-CoA reductase [Clostridium estertheticum]MCB2308223.1 acyl-CoA reductase [Clostridium estertheticum]MCB2346347.1 acyl-CoA reductase [Clostridium estertheticum]MCB2350882.1 acyl-CoA reductase [Clostridium estertheticum]WAG44878.1 acyl-CoA reductase [Clostridium estertheticum]
MINCYELNGEFNEDGMRFKDFNEIETYLNNNLSEIHKIPVEAIILIINEYSKKIAKNREILRVEGVSFLSFYLKKVNIEKQLKLNLENIEYLNKFVQIDDEKYIKAQPRGIVCHWMAGNVPTLGIYSVMQSILCKNGNILRVSKKSVSVVYNLLIILANINVEYEGQTYSSNILLKNIALIYFDSFDRNLNSLMSLKADVRIVWGNKTAVDTICLMPKKTTCKDLIFGPKYSFAVFDKSAIESDDLEEYLENLVTDTIVFGQKGCSSPQVLFIEKSKLHVKDVAKMLSLKFEKITKRYTNLELEEAIAAKIINKRGEYLLGLDKLAYTSKGLKYTILIDSEIKLEEPITGRTIFIKEVEDIFDVCPLITKNIQTIGIASKNRENILEFTDRVTIFGVDRVVKIGYMNFYDSPWDGSLIMSELVRWCSLNIKGMMT